MARRTLHDIENKILDCAIRLGATKGIENISTQEIAKCLGISEPTIFVHFKTKKNLIVQAARKLDTLVKKMITETYFDFLDKGLLYEEIKSTWLRIFEFLVNSPNNTKYYNKYRHSAFYEPTEDYAEDGIYTLAVNIVLQHNAKFAEYADMGSEVVMICAIDSTLNFAEAVIDGKLKKDDITLDLMYKLIFGMLI